MINIEKTIKILKENGVANWIITLAILVFIGKEIGITKEDIKDIYHFLFDNINERLQYIFVYILNAIILIYMYIHNKHIHIKIDSSNKEKQLDNRRTEIIKSYENSIGNEKYERIKQTLRDLLNNYRASRVWFFVYHNGGFTPTGIGKKKMSICFEATNVGITAIGTRFLDMDINFFPDWVGAFVERKDVVVYTLNDNVPEQWLKITETSGYKSLYSSGLWTEEDMPYGFFGMGFQSETILNENDLKFYRETQKKLNNLFAQERNYINIL